MNYKYIGIASIISILSLYIYFKFSKDDNKSKTDELDTKSLFQKIQKNDKILKLLLSHTIKYLKRDKYSDKQLLDRLNKDSLFNKDYDTVRILVDTHNINNQLLEEVFDYSKYVYYLDSDSNNVNNTGGFGRYKNIIGFKFIKAIIPNKSYVIDNTNDTVVYSVENTSGITGTVKVNLIHGYYSIEELPNAFPNTSASFTYDITGGDTITPLSDICIFSTDVSYNSVTHKFSFTANNSTIIKIKFLWGTGGIMNNLIDINVLHKTAKLFGFTPEDQTNYEYTQTSIKVPDMSTHYVDLIVKEIPYIACKNNPNGYHIIERIPLIQDYGENVYFEPYRDTYQNYFLPISLNKLSIELRDPINNTFYNPDANHSFEFELTMIQNTKNVGLFN